jgi:hypothetical protein
MREKKITILYEFILLMAGKAFSGEDPEGALEYLYELCRDAIDSIDGDQNFDFNLKKYSIILSDVVDQKAQEIRDKRRSITWFDEPSDDGNGLPDGEFEIIP